MLPITGPKTAQTNPPPNRKHILDTSISTTSVTAIFIKFLPQSVILHSLSQSSHYTFWALTNTPLVNNRQYSSGGQTRDAILAERQLNFLWETRIGYGRVGSLLDFYAVELLMLILGGSRVWNLVIASAFGGGFMGCSIIGGGWWSVEALGRGIWDEGGIEMGMGM